MPLFNVDHCLVSLLAGWYALILLNVLIRSPVWDVRKKAVEFDAYYCWLSVGFFQAYITLFAFCAVYFVQ
jgi:hypothetical protein